MDIGVATIDRELTDIITSHPVEPNYSLSEISEKENLTKLDGLIIPIEKKDQLSKVIDWLIASQQVPNMFVWVFSTEQVETDEDILRKLGVNEVIEGEGHIPRLFLSIKNFTKKMSSITGKQKSRSYNFLDVRNRSIRIGKKKSVGLTRIEYLILNALTADAENVLSYDELVKVAWPNDPGENKFRLANAVFHLRKKIEKTEYYTITNVRSKGYMLTDIRNQQ